MTFLPFAKYDRRNRCIHYTFEFGRVVDVMVDPIDPMV